MIILEIKLTEPKLKGIRSLEECIFERQSVRSFKDKDIEIGHCAQNIELEAVTLGLGSVPIGAFYDDEVKKVLDLPKNIDPIYIIPIGY
ncbi:MAG: nitroreductase family protein [Candidatus Aminicenantes bacterium]|nr:nitroreductase family protein [Candidatus Aminicenantes bacterium]